MPDGLGKPVDRHRAPRAFLGGDGIEGCNLGFSLLARKLRMKQVDNVGVCPGCHGRAAAKALLHPIIATPFDQGAGLIFVAGPGLPGQRHHHGEPGPIEIDQRAILVEQDAANSGKIWHAVRSWLAPRP